MTRLFFLLFVYLNIYSQELSPIQSFKVDDYNASGQNWMISQSSNGNLYFANNDGLLKYNGNKWSLYPSPKGTIIRSVNYINDKVYTGENTDFGYWIKKKNGSYSYTSIPLKYKGKQASFYTAHNSVSSFTKYKIDSDENIYVWDITDPYSVEEYEVNKLPENYSVIIDDRFHSNNILFSSNDIPYPISFESISNSNILNHNNPDLFSHDKK